MLAVVAPETLMVDDATSGIEYDIELLQKRVTRRDCLFRETNERLTLRRYDSRLLLRFVVHVLDRMPPGHICLKAFAMKN
jgi:hypothetical protein